MEVIWLICFNQGLLKIALLSIIRLREINPLEMFGHWGGYIAGKAFNLCAADLV